MSEAEISRWFELDPGGLNQSAHGRKPPVPNGFGCLTSEKPPVLALQKPALALAPRVSRLSRAARSRHAGLALFGGGEAGPGGASERKRKGSGRPRLGAGRLDWGPDRCFEVVGLDIRIKLAELKREDISLVVF